MKLTNDVPSDWKELQDKVAKYFNEAGYEALTPYSIETVRGMVELDVFVKAQNELAQTIVCECKFWSTPIPQEKIHAFRTVLIDSGVSKGYIISKNGFQSGAYATAEKTNVELLSWDEFVEMIEVKWLEYKTKKLKKISKPLWVYIDILDIPAEKLTEEQKEEYKKTLFYHQGTVIYASQGITEEVIRNYSEEYGIDLTSYEEFVNHIENNIGASVAYYEELFKEVDIPDWKFQF